MSHPGAPATFSKVGWIWKANPVTLSPLASKPFKQGDDKTLGDLRKGTLLVLAEVGTDIEDRSRGAS